MPISRKLLEARIEVVQPGKPQSKDDKYGSHFWSPIKPDCKSRKRVEELDVLLMNREMRERSGESGGIRPQPKEINAEVLSHREEFIPPNAETEVVGNDYEKKTFPPVGAEE